MGNLPKFKNPLTVEDYDYLEVYRYKLTCFKESYTFTELELKQQDAIREELSFIDQHLNLMSRLFGKNVETVLIATRISKRSQDIAVYQFSSIKVAADCLNCDPSLIEDVCKGERKYTAGYYFSWEPAHKPDDNFKKV